MGQRITSTFDAKVTTIEDITGSDTGWANNVTDALTMLKSANNNFGTAALLDTGTGTGDVVEVGSSGKIATSLINTATTGGTSADAGKIGVLNSSGKYPATMLDVSGGGSGRSLIAIKVYYGNVGPGGTAGSPNNANKQYDFTYTKPSNVTSLLVFATGGGGSGSYGPPETTTNNPNGTSNSIPGWQSRKGGGGAGGSTGIKLISSPAATYSVKVGYGGPERLGTASNKDQASAYSGGTSAFGTEVTAGGGNPGDFRGNGGVPTAASAGGSNTSLTIRGGNGHDGTDSRWGAGSGGSTYWGGGFSGGTGRDRPNSGDAFAAPGAGGGGATGSAGIHPYGFTPNATGHPGNHGIVVVYEYG